MDFYTVVLRKSGIQHVALCLENGLVGQGITKEDSMKKLKEAIDSVEDVYKDGNGIYNALLSIKELHEFLTVEGKEPISEEYELRAVHA
ncbi:MAG: type II toxin-antitoxin system HicB family antitoxin [Candidatus Anammoxibacter sp.]